MLGFHREAFAGLLHEDGLLVMSKGLGIQRLLARFVRLHSETPRGKMVFVLGAAKEYEMLRAAMLADGVPADEVPLLLDSRVPVPERERLFQRGGCFVVTSQILVLDLLSKRAEPSRVKGVLVQHAHHVTESSTEAFILRIIRSASRSDEGGAKAFVKAFSDDPVRLATGFGRLRQVLSELGVRKLYLWPRFHQSVRQAFAESTAPDVVELSQQLTPAMKECQQAIIEAMDLCIRGLRRSAHIEVSELTVENSLFTSFTDAILAQLNPVWNRVSPKIKRLVTDLRTLRRLLFSLLADDCASFHLLCENAKRESDFLALPSEWLMSEAGDRLLRHAKARVYSVTESPNVKIHNAKVSGGAAVEQIRVRGEDGVMRSLSLSLEVNPKWELLRKVLDEITAESEVMHQGTTNSHGPSEVLGGCEAVVFFKEERTAKRLRQYLAQGSGRSVEEHSEVMLHCFHSVLDHRSRAHESVVQNDESNAPGERDPVSHRHKRQRKSNILAPSADTTMPTRSRNTEAELLNRAYDKTSALVSGGGQSSSVVGNCAHKEEGVCACKMLRRRGQVLLCTRDLAKTRLSVLDEMRPNFAVVFDPDMHWIREIEVFQAENPQHPLRVYFLIFEDSVEEQRYLSDLKRERDSFQMLIREKSTLVMTSAGMLESAVSEVKLSGMRSRQVIGVNLSTNQAILGRPGQCRAVGVKESDDQQVVIVDQREFRSSLPSMLHKRGLCVLPVTLEVGDYILSPEICVERKSLSDLFGSFASGRLYNQAESMCRHYEHPCLLIEFDSNRPFSLSGSAELSGEISERNVVSKMVLLTRHFPKLRILWSRDPLNTVDIFVHLKRGHEQPEPRKAAAVGCPEDAGRLFSGPTTNIAAQEILRRVPGVTRSNVYTIQQKVRSLRELATMKVAELEPIMGKVGAEKLVAFFARRVATSELASFTQ